MDRTTSAMQHKCLLYCNPHEFCSRSSRLSPDSHKVSQHDGHVKRPANTFQLVWSPSICFVGPSKKCLPLRIYSIIFGRKLKTKHTQLSWRTRIPFICYPSQPSMMITWSNIFIFSLQNFPWYHIHIILEGKRGPLIPVLSPFSP